MKFLVMFVVASALVLLSIKKVAGQQCDAEANATLVDALLGRQPVLECVFGLTENYTFQNENEYAAITALSEYNKSAFAAVDQGNCSALNTSVLGIVDMFFYLDYALENDTAAIESGLRTAFHDCIFPNETCDIAFLTSNIILSQYAIGCYLNLANGSYQLTEDLEELLNVLSALNDTAIYAAIANQCDTSNASLVQILYTTDRISELIYNGSDTNLSDALTTCLFVEPPCSIKDLNATLSKYEPVYDCLCDLENYFNLTDPESEKLDDTDIAYVQACLAVDGGDNCTAVSDDVQSFVDTIQEFIDLVTSDNASSADLINAVYECGNSTAE